MNCQRCEQRMKSKKGPYRYEPVKGIQVALKGIEVRGCPGCGEIEVSIPRIDELHRRIAYTMIRKQERLAPAETRFLRKFLEWSGVDFAAHMGVSPETVSRWEQGKDPMGPVADRLLRLIVHAIDPAEDYPLESLKGIKRTSRRPARLGLRARGKNWVAAPA